MKRRRAAVEPKRRTIDWRASEFVYADSDEDGEVATYPPPRGRA